MTKKLFLILICVLVVAVCLPTFVVAETSSESTTTTETVANDVHFIAPTGIALVGDYLLVSDNVADNQSAILCFDIANGNAHKFTQIIDKEIISLSGSNGRLFVIFADSFVEYKIAEDKKSVEVVETFDFANVIDVCVGKLGSDDTTYFLQKGSTNDSLKYAITGNESGNTNLTMDNAYDCLSLANGTNNYVYIAGKDSEGNNNIKRWGCKNGWSIGEDILNLRNVTYSSGFKLLGIIANNRQYPVVYGAKSMYNLNPNGDNNPFLATDGSFGDFSSQKYDFVDVTSNTDYLAILNSNNQVQLYSLNGGETLVESKGEIGSDQVSTAVPTTFTGFTLAKSTGYPTNIVYKTIENTSVEKILTKDEVGEFVILNYEGCEQSAYYYVFVNGRFGWIKKSDSATITNGTIVDEKIATINTKVSDKVNYNAKFSSLGTVYVYDLPCSDDSIRNEKEVSQTALTMTNVTLLQVFKENNIIWYYVEYGADNARGFVKSSDVGQFTATLVAPVDAVLDKQINASLFNAVTLHVTNDLSPDTVITYDGTNPVKLYSGDWVKLIEVDEETGASLVQVVAQDGTTTYGWVESSRLIEVDQITTNAIVGLSAFGFAIVLAIVFMTVFIKRKKKIK